MKKLCAFFLLVCFLCTLWNGSMTFAYCQEALVLWFEKLVPSMFIAMVLVRMMYQLQVFHLFRFRLLSQFLGIDEHAMPLFICALFLGFPSGSQFIDESYARGELHREGAQRLLYICTISTTGFIIMTCGVTFFHSVNIGLFLYGIQLLAIVILLRCTHHLPIQGSHQQPSSISFMQAMSQAIKDSGKSLYMIGGYLMLFMSVMGVVFSLLPEVASLPLRMIAEFSSGSVLIHQLSISTAQQLLMLSGLFGFGGFCVHMQIVSMVSNIPIRYSIFLRYRILQALLSILLFLLLYPIFF